MRAFAYIRVSTEEQDLENQRRALILWAEEHGVKIERFYEDVASGAKPLTEREGFRKMLEDIERGDKPDVLLVFELSRIARSLGELFKALDLLEKKHGIPVVSVSPRERFLSTLDRSVREFVLAALGFAAEMEREMIRQRTKAAMAPYRKELGDDVKAKIAELYRSGEGIRSIAKRLGVSEYLVRRTLSELGLIEVGEGICPRCFSKMRLVETVVQGDKVVKRYYCPHCGYEALSTS
ncbi:MAG: recombinase family protein [Thermoproteus sp.]